MANHDQKPMIDQSRLQTPSVTLIETGSRMREFARVAVLLLLSIAVLPASGTETGSENPRGARFVVELPCLPQTVRRPVIPVGYSFTFHKSQGCEPRLSLNWFKPEPFFAIEVRDFSSEQTRDVDDTADGFPDRLSKLPAGKYFIQAVLDRDLDHHDPATSPGMIVPQSRLKSTRPAIKRFCCGSARSFSENHFQRPAGCTRFDSGASFYPSSISAKLSKKPPWRCWPVTSN